MVSGDRGLRSEPVPAAARRVLLPGRTVCTMRLPENCQAPCIWLGPGTVCDPNPCPGACCTRTASAARQPRISAWRRPLERRIQLRSESVSAASSGRVLLPQRGLRADHEAALHGHLASGVDDVRSESVSAADGCLLHSGRWVHADRCGSLPGSERLAREWVVCDPNPCPQPPTGACCNPTTGECALTIQTACLAPNVWHAEWTSCTPNQCPQPVPTEKTSWGQIKNKYR